MTIPAWNGSPPRVGRPSAPTLQSSPDRRGDPIRTRQVSQRRRGVFEKLEETLEKKEKQKKERTAILPGHPSWDSSWLLSSSSWFFGADGPLRLILRRRS